MKGVALHTETQHPPRAHVDARLKGQHFKAPCVLNKKRNKIPMHIFCWHTDTHIIEMDDRNV